MPIGWGCTVFYAGRIQILEIRIWSGNNLKLHLENLLPSLITASHRWQPYCCWFLATIPCWFSWRRMSIKASWPTLNLVANKGEGSSACEVTAWFLAAMLVLIWIQYFLCHVKVFYSVILITSEKWTLACDRISALVFPLYSQNWREIKLHCIQTRTNLASKGSFCGVAVSHVRCQNRRRWASHVTCRTLKKHIIGQYTRTAHCWQKDNLPHLILVHVASHVVSQNPFHRKSFSTGCARKLHFHRLASVLPSHMVQELGSVGEEASADGATNLFEQKAFRCLE